MISVTYRVYHNSIWGLKKLFLKIIRNTTYNRKFHTKNRFKFLATGFDMLSKMTILFFDVSRSPDLTTCDYFLWCYIKNHMFIFLC